MSEFEGIETVSGHIDFGHELDHLRDELVPHHERELPEAIAQGLPTEEHVLPVNVTRPKKAHYRTYVLDGVSPIEITLPYPERTSLTVTCQSGGPVRVGADNEITASATDARSVALPNDVGRTFTHTDKIFCHGPAGAVVDVIEEHR